MSSQQRCEQQCVFNPPSGPQRIEEKLWNRGAAPVLEPVIHISLQRRGRRHFLRRSCSSINWIIECAHRPLIIFTCQCFRYVALESSSQIIGTKLYSVAAYTSRANPRWLISRGPT